MSNKYYNYILLDPRKPYKWQYKDISIDYLLFYVGKERRKLLKDIIGKQHDN